MTEPDAVPGPTDTETSLPSSSELIEGDETRPPLIVKLADLWSDYVRGMNVGRDPDAPRRSPSSVPILDDMKGILQWE